MAEPADRPQGGVQVPLRALGAAVLGLLETHVAILGVELAEEKERLRELVVLAALAAAGITLGLLTLSAFLVVAFWDSYRLQVLAALTLVYLGLGIWAMLAFTRSAARHPNPLTTSVAELAKDRERLKG